MLDVAKRFFALALIAAALAGPAHAQTATGAAGRVVGRVIDAESEAALEGVSVRVFCADPADPASPQREETLTALDGSFAFAAVRAGVCDLEFEKSGYRESTMTGFAVRAGEENRADFPLPRLPRRAAEEMPGFEEFIVEASPMEEILAASRLDADELINTLSAAEFAKFAASDVADALKFVPGVNVVDGQFAIIRGLEDRYNSTLYNGAVVPSPDPDSQSVQLDLFPSDVVTNLVVSKTFGPDLPSNSSGGAINVLTNEYPESFEAKLSLGSGVNSNAYDEFFEFNGGSPVGSPTDGWNTLGSNYGFSLGGRSELVEREVRFKLVGASDRGYDTLEGEASGKEPDRAQTRAFPPPTTVVESGDLSLGELSLSAGSFDLTESEESNQLTGYLGLGFDLDPAGRNTLDATIFYTEKKQKTVQQYENGYLEGFDYSRLAEKQANGDEIDDNADFNGFATRTAWIARSVRGNPSDSQSAGPLWSSSFAESDSFDVTRDLIVYQLNGDHRIEALDGLHLSWAANTARTTQKEESLGVQYFYEPADTSQIPTEFPVTVESLGPGRYYANAGILSSSNDIDERQDFARIDADYSFPIGNDFALELRGGYWFENATRDVGSQFLESPSVSGRSNFAISADSAEALGSSIFDPLDRSESGLISGTRVTTSDGRREVSAFSFGSKATFWERIDLLAGARFESLSIESNNEPFTGELAFDGSPQIYPNKYLFFDRLDNPARGEVIRPPPPGTTFNDQLLGVEVPVDETTGFVDLIDEEQIDALINGEIDESRVLPAFGINYRPLDGLTARAAYSQTVARPSFREMGFYVAVEPGSDDLIVGNPQLTLSDVSSYDLRTEYVWGELGDLAALSAFYKTIDDPIESIVVRDPTNFEGASSALYRTFFNNPNQATLWGVEVELRKNLGFLGPAFAEYFSIGGNFTYIDATVDRTEAELARSTPFFGVANGDRASFTSYESDRRLFGQPEWIANADLSYDNPDAGTRITLSFFGISDILDAAGSAALSPNGSTISFTLDRYLDSFTQLNLVASQTWYVDALGGGVTLKGNMKNLTDSTRRIVYDQEQTNDRIASRTWKQGLDYSFSLTYTFTF